MQRAQKKREARLFVDGAGGLAKTITKKPAFNAEARRYLM